MGSHIPSCSRSVILPTSSSSKCLFSHLNSRTVKLKSMPDLKPFKWVLSDDLFISLCSATIQLSFKFLRKSVGDSVLRVV